MRPASSGLWGHRSLTETLNVAFVLIAPDDFKLGLPRPLLAQRRRSHLFDPCLNLGD
jgi:hypothetical protein